MIWNIVDESRNTYQWHDLNAVIENTYHDDTVEGADILGDDGTSEGVYEDRTGISLHDAIVWAQAHPEKVTLFLYSRGGGIE